MGVGLFTGLGQLGSNEGDAFVANREFQQKAALQAATIANMQQHAAIAQQQANTMEGYRKQQEQAISGGLPFPASAEHAQFLGVPVGTPITYKTLADFAKTQLQNEGRLGVANVNKDARLGAAAINVQKVSPEERVVRQALGIPLGETPSQADAQRIQASINNNKAFPRIQGAMAYARNAPIAVQGEDGLPTFQTRYNVAQNPGQFNPMTLAGANKILGQRASLAELHNNLDYVHVHADSLAEAPIASAIALHTPASSFGAVVQGLTATGALSPDQFNAVMGVRRLIENSANIKALAQVAPFNSDTRFRALVAQLPDEATIASAGSDPQRIRSVIEGFENSMKPIEETYGPLLTRGFGPTQTSQRPNVSQPQPNSPPPASAIPKAIQNLLSGPDRHVALSDGSEYEIRGGKATKIK